MPLTVAHESDRVGNSVAPIAMWIALGAASCAAMGPLEPNLLEEGFVVHIAQRISHGERLYSQIANFTGPLPFELLALLFQWFGEEIVVARGAVIVLAGLACGSAFVIGQRAGAGALAHGAAALIAAGPVLLFPFHSIYFYSTLAYDLILITAAVAVFGMRSTGWAIAAGVLAACVALCKQSVGAVFALGLVSVMLACAPHGRRFVIAGSAAAGGLAVAGLTLLFYATRGDVGALFESLVVLPLSFEDAFDSVFINLWPPGTLAPELQGYAHFYTPFVYSLLRGEILRPPSWTMTLVTQLVFALPFVALAATALRRWAGPLPPAVWIHWVALASLTASLFPRTDWGHVVFVIGPAAVQLLLLAPRVSSSRSRWRNGLAVLLVLVVGTGTVSVGRGLWKLAGPATLGTRAPLRAVSPNLKDPSLVRVIEYLKTHTTPGEAIFVARSEPLIYFATDTRNPTRYAGVFPGDLQRQEQEILAALDPVRFVVMSDIDQPLFTFYAELLPQVQAYFERHFSVAKGFLGENYGWIIVLERGESRHPVAIDLMEIRAGARPWGRRGNGASMPVAQEVPRLATTQNRRPMPVHLGPWGGGVDFEIDVPVGAVFESDVGLASIPGSHYQHPRAVDFSLSVGMEGEFKQLASARVLTRAGDGKVWQPFRVDLAEFAGQHVVLRLEVASAARLRQRRLAWWGSPKVVTQPTAAAPKLTPRTLRVLD